MKAVGKGARTGLDYVSGETVNGGSFRCSRCGERLSVPERRVVNLPVCPRCQGQRWQLR